MGEAKRRAERRREAREKGVLFVPQVIVKGQDYAPFFVPNHINDELKIEFAHFKKEHSELTGGIRDYMVALLETAVEFQRRGREEREAKDNLVVPATSLPPGMKEAADRLQALKRGV